MSMGWEGRNKTVEWVQSRYGSIVNVDESELKRLGIHYEDLIKGYYAAPKFSTKEKYIQHIRRRGRTETAVMAIIIGIILLAGLSLFSIITYESFTG